VGLAFLMSGMISSEKKLSFQIASASYSGYLLFQLALAISKDRLFSIEIASLIQNARH